MKESPNTLFFLQNNLKYLEQLRKVWRRRVLFTLNPRIRKLYKSFLNQTDDKLRNACCAEVLNAYEGRVIWRIKIWTRCALEDIRVFFTQFGRRRTVDHSSKKSHDYYSVVVIVKNEARYIREFIYFYQATGADRIYLYDNDSEDGILKEIEPFIETGYVVYRRWPGRKVQTAAYRDAVRRTKRRTKWLAIIDADEFLFSPQKQVSVLLREFEDYPGVGANWVVFGPNNHQDRPPGLVMDNYTTTPENNNVLANCHTKSIVQPKEVFCIYHTHHALYKWGRFAVDSKKETIDNYSSYIPRAGRVFTPVNYRDLFRINHYTTKSLEDLRAKCLRGFADGAPNAVFEKKLSVFDVPLVEDKVIEPYAKIVRERLKADR